MNYSFDLILMGIYLSGNGITAVGFETMASYLPKCTSLMGIAAHLNNVTRIPPKFALAISNLPNMQRL